MKFPKHWAKADIETAGPDGDKFLLSAWGWSEMSASGAEAAARAAVQRMAERVARSGRDALVHYGYAERPLREPVLEQLEAGVISRNSYGCEVLNTTRAMFIDIDVGEPAPPPGFIGRLFGKRDEGDTVAKEAVARVEAWTTRNPPWGFRVYRTRAGLRLLATHASFDAEKDGRFEVMKELGADPLYMRLCEGQKSYRARLTPKPWRCDVRSPPAAWPFPNVAAERHFAEWETRYREKSAGFATCSLVRQVGSTQQDGGIEPVVRLHDARTRATSGLPLA